MIRGLEQFSCEGMLREFGVVQPKEKAQKDTRILEKDSLSETVVI